MLSSALVGGGATFRTFYRASAAGGGSRAGTVLQPAGPVERRLKLAAQVQVIFTA
jgi:hypothetical protein